MRILLFLISILLIGCKSNITKPAEDIVENNAPTPFFSLNRLVAKESAKMNQQHCSAYKTVIIKDNVESIQQDSIDWKKELRPIAMADINKTAWISYFDVDTIPVSNGAYIVKYTTQSARIPIKLLEVQFDSLQQPVKVNIFRSSKNIFFESSQKIEYQPGIGFKAEGTQNVLFLKNQNFNIDSKFICQP